MSYFFGIIFSFLQKLPTIEEVRKIVIRVRSQASDVPVPIAQLPNPLRGYSLPKYMPRSHAIVKLLLFCCFASSSKTSTKTTFPIVDRNKTMTIICNGGVWCVDMFWLWNKKCADPTEEQKQPVCLCVLLKCYRKRNIEDMLKLQEERLNWKYCVQSEGYCRQFSVNKTIDVEKRSMCTVKLQGGNEGT